MIKSLHIKNFALVDEITIEFREGLNIITGETGAGKSILVNAIGQLCGERSSIELVRDGADKAIIEALIDVQPTGELKNVVKRLDFEIDNLHAILIRKEIKSAGSARIFVNDSPVTLNKLNQLSKYLFDLHGQYQHQQLLHPENHIIYLDNFGGLAEEIDQFGALFDRYRKAIKELDELKSQQLQAYQQHDMYRYQNEELSKADLDAEELDQLKAEMQLLSNVEELHQCGSTVNALLYSGEQNASHLLTQAEAALASLAELDPQFKEMQENLISAREAIEEIGRFSEEYISEIEFNPERLEKINQRIAQLEFLLKKYQKQNISELIKFHSEIANLQNNLDHFDELIKQKEKEIKARIDEIRTNGLALSEKRKTVSTDFQEKITEVIKQIGMPHSVFRISRHFKESDTSPFIVDGKSIGVTTRGFDFIQFEIASNAGEPYKPINKIASGGELSRIMLALKSVLASADQVPTLIFDEIDAGVSGKIAQVVGQKMAELSRFHQILCVTHLPQIASFAQTHYKVSKFVEENRTFVDIDFLNEEARLKEVAALLGGKDLSRQALDNAMQLIVESQKIREQF